MPVGRAEVWSGREEAELDRGACVPTWVASGQRHAGTSAVLCERKEAGVDKTFTGRSSLSSRGQSMWPPGLRVVQRVERLQTRNVLAECAAPGGQASVHVLA